MQAINSYVKGETKPFLMQTSDLNFAHIMSPSLFQFFSVLGEKKDKFC